MAARRGVHALEDLCSVVHDSSHLWLSALGGMSPELSQNITLLAILACSISVQLHQAFDDYYRLLHGRGLQCDCWFGRPFESILPFYI